MHTQLKDPVPYKLSPHETSDGTVKLRKLFHHMGQHMPCRDTCLARGRLPKVSHWAL